MVLDIITKKNLVRIITLNSAGESVNFNIDATSSITHNFNASITKNPIEDGSSITDHISLEPRTLTINGLISETPLRIENTIANTLITAISGQVLPSFIQGSIVALFQNSSDRISDGYKILKELWQNKQPFAIQTGFELYENMIIQSLSIPENIQRGVFFNMTLQQIKFVQTEYIKIPEVNVSEDVKHTASSQYNEGKKTTKQITEAKNSSLLFKATEMFGIIK